MFILYLLVRQLFVAYGNGPDFKTIYTNSNNSGTSELADQAHMRSITGFYASKSNRCKIASGSNGPNRYCIQSETINNARAPGVATVGNSLINFFNYTDGIFNICALTSSLQNAMGE